MAATSKRVGLVTLHRVHNFGSVLQAYATQELLRSAGVEPIILDYWRPSEVDTVQGQLKHNYARWNRNWLTSTAFRAVRGPALRRQAQGFRSYVERNLCVSRPLYSIEQLDQASRELDLDALVVGSDQVWNSEYNVHGSEPFFLRFGPRDIPRISIASSFGKGTLTDEERKHVERDLVNFSHVSVREQSAAESLAALGVKAQHVIDPTLGLTPERWRSIARGEVRERPYLLVYHLHRSHDLRRVVAEVSRARGLEVVWVRGYASLAPGRSLSDMIPEEFLGLLLRATFVVTDSFHGTAFSLNLEVPFITVLPPNYGERIRSLASLTGTSDRVVNPGHAHKEAELDFSTARRVLASERDSLFRFIKESV